MLWLLLLPASAKLLLLLLLLLLTFLLFLMVTRDTPGTGFMPSFCIAFLLFFSERLCLPPLPMPPSSPSSSAQMFCRTSAIAL
jgi:hypothetical protein